MQDWKKFEFRIAEKLSGKRNTMSGALDGNADVTTHTFGVECKTTEKCIGYYNLKLETWNKASVEARLNGNLPAIAMEMQEGTVLLAFLYEDLRHICLQAEPDIWKHFMIFENETFHGRYKIEQSVWKSYVEIADASEKTPLWVIRFRNESKPLSVIDLELFQQIHELSEVDE